MSEFRIEIVPDEHATNPREDMDGMWTFALSHKRYDLPNESGLDFDDYDGWTEFRQAIMAPGNIAMIREVHGYDHSGLAFGLTPFTCPFDSGQLGFAYITNEELVKEYGPDTPETRAKAVSYLENELELYQTWSNGGVLAVDIYEDGEVVESCCCLYSQEAAEEAGQELLELAKQNSLRNPPSWVLTQPRLLLDEPKLRKHHRMHGGTLLEATKIWVTERIQADPVLAETCLAAVSAAYGLHCEPAHIAVVLLPRKASKITIEDYGRLGKLFADFALEQEEQEEVPDKE
jgi:hypothetical protein